MPATVRLVAVTGSGLAVPTVRIVGVTAERPTSTSTVKVRLVGVGASTAAVSVVRVRIVGAKAYGTPLPSSGRWRWRNGQWWPVGRRRDRGATWT